MPVEDLIPSLRVTDLERSIAFYQRLGFAVEDRREEEGWLLWVRLRSADSALMLLLAADPPHAHDPGVLLYLYTRALEPLRQALEGTGSVVGEIETGRLPGSARELEVTDPDGHALVLAERP